MTRSFDGAVRIPVKCHVKNMLRDIGVCFCCSCEHCRRLQVQSVLCIYRLLYLFLTDRSGETGRAAYDPTNERHVHFVYVISIAII